MELVVLDIIGTIAFTISGFIVATKNKLDLLGITLISFMSAFGGGVVRDLLVDRTPFIFSETYPLIVSLVVIVIAILLKLYSYEKLEDSKVFILADTIGLSVFAYSGAMLGMQYNFNFMGVLFLALLTATGGGIIRDIILNKVPYVLVGDFYGSIAVILGIIVFFTYGYTSAVVAAGIIISGVLIRMIAIKFKWKLPSYS